MKRKPNPPKAKFLMGSMRHMGYSFSDAVADVMDNSISAGCTYIKLLFPTNPDNIYVGILDDGCGMSDQELFRAMCYGSQANEKEREENDLGDEIGFSLPMSQDDCCQQERGKDERISLGL